MPRKKKSKRTRKTSDTSHLDILDLFIKLYKENGCPPPLSCMQDLSGTGAFVRKAMKRLLTEGYVTQPFRGSYCPLKDSKGKPVEIAISVGEKGKTTENLAILSDFNESLLELIKTVVGREGVDPGPSEGKVAALIAGHIEDFKKDVGFHLEAGESKTRKLTETLEGILDLPELLSALQEEVDLLQGERAGFKAVQKELADLSESIEKIEAWREGMAKIFTG